MELQFVKRWLKSAICTLLKMELSESEMAQMFCDQVNRIRDFVEKHPSHAFIELRLEDPNAGAILSNVFGVNASCWGNKNQNNNK